MTKASIIVPVLNRENFIKDCIDSLLDQAFEDYEVIIVDDGSTDKTRDILSGYKDLRIKILYNDTPQGPSFSRNRAAQQAQGEFLAFTDSDCVVYKDWLEQLLTGFRKGCDIEIVGGEVLDPKTSNYWERVNAQGDFVAKKEGFVKKVIGCNMAVKRESFLKNKLDERVYPAEELDLCIRCTKKNKRIYYVPSARVVHFRRDSLLLTVKQQFSYGFWNAFVNFKNRNPPFISVGAWILFFGLLLLGFGHFSTSAGFLLLYLGLVVYIGISQKKLDFRKLIKIYPGFFISCLLNSGGSLCGVLPGIINLFRKK